MVKDKDSAGMKESGESGYVKGQAAVSYFSEYGKVPTSHVP